MSYAAQQLIAEGAEPDCVDDRGYSPLIHAASFYEELDGVTARLIAAGAELDVVNEDGNSALIAACSEKNADNALLLIMAGAALNLLDRDGKSALDWANEKGLAATADSIRARGGRTGAEIKAGK